MSVGHARQQLQVLVIHVHRPRPLAIDPQRVLSGSSGFQFRFASTSRSTTWSHNYWPVRIFYGETWSKISRKMRPADCPVTGARRNYAKLLPICKGQIPVKYRNGPILHPTSARSTPSIPHKSLSHRPRQTRRTKREVPPTQIEKCHPPCAMRRVPRSPVFHLAPCRSPQPPQFSGAAWPSQPTGSSIGWVAPSGWVGGTLPILHLANLPLGNFFQFGLEY